MVNITQPLSTYVNNEDSSTYLLKWSNTDYDGQYAFEVLYKTKSSDTWLTTGKIESSAEEYDLRNIHTLLGIEIDEIQYRLIVYYKNFDYSSGSMGGSGNTVKDFSDASYIYSLIFNSGSNESLKIYNGKSTTEYPLFSDINNPNIHRLNIQTNSGTKQLPLVDSDSPIAGSAKIVINENGNKATKSFANKSPNFTYDVSRLTTYGTTNVYTSTPIYSKDSKTMGNTGNMTASHYDGVYYNTLYKYAYSSYYGNKGYTRYDNNYGYTRYDNNIGTQTYYTVQPYYYISGHYTYYKQGAYAYATENYYKYQWYGYGPFAYVVYGYGNYWGSTVVYGYYFGVGTHYAYGPSYNYAYGTVSYWYSDYSRTYKDYYYRGITGYYFRAPTPYSGAGMYPVYGNIAHYDYYSYVAYHPTLFYGNKYSGRTYVIPQHRQYYYTTYGNYKYTTYGTYYYRTDRQYSTQYYMTTRYNYYTTYSYTYYTTYYYYYQSGYDNRSYNYTYQVK